MIYILFNGFSKLANKTGRRFIFSFLNTPSFYHPSNPKLQILETERRKQNENEMSTVIRLSPMAIPLFGGYATASLLCKIPHF
jgi:hypothetical protein